MKCVYERKVYQGKIQVTTTTQYRFKYCKNDMQ